jgi:hypothetical protein
VVGGNPAASPIPQRRLAMMKCTKIPRMMKKVDRRVGKRK